MNRLREIITRESSFEGDSSNLLLLVRILLLMFIPYTFFVSLLCFRYGQPGYGLLTAVFLVLFGSLLVASYSVRAGMIRFIMTLALACMSYVMASAFGWRESFQLLLFVCFFLFWYDPALSIRRKFIQSGIICLIFCVICFISPKETSLVSSDTAGFQFLIYANIVISVLCLSVTAYFYCTQFVEAERKLQRYNKELKKLSETDQLTKLPNRRYALDELQDIENKFETAGNLVSIAIGDIDFFKKVNDNYGHDAGDYVLSELARVLSKFMEDKGFVARWGGEEFLFVFEASNGDDAFMELDRLRNIIQNTEFVFRDTRIPITMTIGVEEFGGPRVGVDPTIAAADKKLYLGKASGRNQVVY